MNNILSFIKKNTVTVIAFFAAAVTAFIVPPDKEYLGYFETLSCQFISNVPSAILLSQFTSDYPHLLVGVNIGGVGTLISSLASLITFREYTSRFPGQTKRYISLFSVFSFGFLTVLTGLMLIIM